ncbi:CCL5 protein, partial [Tricholaema leucomelas]|nr:CCL5 protein [Tricholaema leucomelas]
TASLSLSLSLPSFSLLPAHFQPLECCYRYAAKPLPHPQSFYRTPRDCNLPAIVIVGASGHKVCADPSKAWVKRAIRTMARKK